MKLFVDTQVYIFVSIKNERKDYIHWKYTNIVHRVYIHIFEGCKFMFLFVSITCTKKAKKNYFYVYGKYNEILL